MLKQWIGVSKGITTHRQGLPAEYRNWSDMLGIRLFEKYTAHYLPTYKMARAGRFTNVLLAMMVMALFEKDLRMKAD